MTSLQSGLYRNEFSHIDDNIYLNHCALGPIPERSFKAAETHLKERSSGAIDSFELDEPVMQTCRRNAARLVNSPSEEQIALISNTSHGLNLICAEMPWEKGDEIILSDIEFPTNIYPYIHSTGGKTKVIKVDGSDGKVPVERIEDAITPRTKVIAVSAVQFLSGYRADLETIGRICKKNGIYLIVDAIQAAGCCPLDVQRMQIDALVTGGHKWLLSLQGTGFMYISPEFQKQLQPAYAGWLSVEEPWDLLNTDQPLAGGAVRYEGGMYNGPGVHVLKHSLQLLLDAGVDNIYHHTVSLQNHFLSLIAQDTVSVYGADDDANRSGILALRLPPNTDGESVITQFKDAAITVSIRENILRIAPHLYNTKNEIEQAAEVLQNVPVQ